MDHVDRIKELNKKATQVLVFLSFALMAAATLSFKNSMGEGSNGFLGLAMRHWVWAIFPTVLVVLPAKELGREKPGWYKFLRWTKFWLLFIAVLLIAWGTCDFLRAVGGGWPFV